MQSRRWALALVITVMLIDSCVKRAQADSFEPSRTASASRRPAVPHLGGAPEIAVTLDGLIPVRTAGRSDRSPSRAAWRLGPNSFLAAGAWAG